MECSDPGLTPLSVLVRVPDAAVCESGTMTRLILKDELLDAQLLRTIGTAPYGGADVGECLATAARVDGTSLTSWHDAWVSTGERVYRLAEAELAAGRLETAREAFFRSSNYFRTAGVMLMGAPVDDRLRTANARQTDVFRRGAALLSHPPEILAIPYEGTTLPGYHFQVDGDDRPRPTVVLVGGYDGTAEELYFLNGSAALARGYNVLAFDGPGQGAALLQQGLVLRPDFETVISAVMDFVEQRPGTDVHRVALIGLSLGGYLAPRAASGEHRVAACIADCGSYDLFGSALERIPAPLAPGLRDGKDVSRRVLRRVLTVLEAKPTAGWALRRGQLVHGVDDPIEYLLALRDYSMSGRAELVTCPTFVCNAEGDDISTSAPRLFEALRSEKKYVLFRAVDGAGDHCEAGARTLYHALSFGWLDGTLQHHPDGPAGGGNGAPPEQ
jgi:pimeloyl-ACP methyl ester carboxylesterase